MVQTQKNSQRTVSRWLLWLLIVQIITLTYTALTNVVDFGGWNDWLKLAFSAGVLVGLFMLHRQHKLYLAAFVLALVSFLATAVSKLVLTNPAMIRAFYDWFRLKDPMTIGEMGSKLLKFGNVCTMAGFLLQLLAHRTIVKGKCVPLCKSWLWLTVAVLALNIVMQVLTLIVANLLSGGTLNVELYQQVYPFLNLPGFAVEILYAILLLQTIRWLRKYDL